MFILMYLLGILFLLLPYKIVDTKRSFVIDYENNRFLKNGQPYRYISGSIHYFRIPSYYWQDRLTKIKAAGLNAVEFYIPWNIHEPTEGNFSFEDETDVLKFIQLAYNLDLDVILRVGPYTCGEFENGGFPWWLLKISDIRMRTADPRFLYYVTKWYVKLMPMLQPYLYKNGGPIISIQIENEYGSRSYCDRNYTTFLRDLIRSYVGNDTILFTVDGGGLSYLKCGYIPDVYPTVDFGCGSKEGIANSFAAQRQYAPKGPLVNSEFYPGWLDLWGYNHSTLTTEPILSSMTYMYDMGASFNFYMFEGGTNFGYMNGASGDNEPVTTSYDYDAPLSEAGDPTPKYFAIKQHIEKMTGQKVNVTVPKATQKSDYGSAPLALLGDVLTLLETLSPKNDRKWSLYPKTFEQIDFPYGFVLYETELNFDCACNISVPGVNDRGYIMVDGALRGLVVIKKLTSLTTKVKKGSKLQILVENNGRQCSGFNDPKGISGNVTADDIILTNWTIYPLSIEKIFDDVPLNKFKSRPKRSDQTLTFSPSIYYGKFKSPVVTDTFFNPQNWTKGQFFINGFNVGRYWPSLGPQITLFVPKTVVKKLNYVVVLELEAPGNCQDSNNFTCSISFTDIPILNKTVTGPTKKYKKFVDLPSDVEKHSVIAT